MGNEKGIMIGFRRRGSLNFNFNELSLRKKKYAKHFDQAFLKSLLGGEKRKK